MSLLGWRLTGNRVRVVCLAVQPLIPTMPHRQAKPRVEKAKTPAALAASATPSAEAVRLADDATRARNWKRWGTYLPERQWGTVREDYSADGDVWKYFTHEDARLRAYRWGEDGLLGWTDRECRLCFGIALWNERDAFLKERLFGLSGPEGNHGEDVKELYYYLDATPTHSYCRALYKYPQRAFPYDELRRGNRERGLNEREFEITETGVFDDGRYFDVYVAYAKADENDTAIRITAHNRGKETAPLHIVPQLWFRNTWIWGCKHEGCTLKPRMWRVDDRCVATDHETLGRFNFAIASADAAGDTPALMFTENISNSRALGWGESYTPYVKDAFHRRVVHNEGGSCNPKEVGTKFGAHYRFDIEPGASVVITARLWHVSDDEVRATSGGAIDRIFEQRISEMRAYYDESLPSKLTGAERAVVHQAHAGLLWTKQFYHYSVADWLEGDPDVARPPSERSSGRNVGWEHLFSRNVISMPDKWEFPWFAAWDLAFHMIPFARVDPQFAKDQLILFLREWYMHPNGHLPAYEFALGDVNPPVHAWACWRVYKMTGPHEKRDLAFLARVFHKLLINFTWWVNRKDPQGRNIFAGGFLGLDNIGVFDRSKQLPADGQLRQADATAWVAFFCTTMLAMALELAHHDAAYEDVASKFFEHFIGIADAMNHLGGSGLWDENDGFYYDQLAIDGHGTALKVRSMVGIIPLFAAEILSDEVLEKLPGFRRRMEWFLTHRQDVAHVVACMEAGGRARRLLAIPSRERLERVLRYVLDEREFLSPFGVRALSQIHLEHPFQMQLDGEMNSVDYAPGESDTYLFGGNSNWRGPIWMPVNFLLIEALERYHHFYGDEFTVEYPTGSGTRMSLAGVARDLSRRLCSIFLPDESGARPCHGGDQRYTTDPHFRDLLLFNEYFHGDSGCGCGVSHQTGWTVLVAKLLIDRVHERNIVGKD